MSYDFSTLDDKEFEVFCRDILNASLKLKLQAFKSGKDKGIDLRYSSAKTSNEIIVQAKHYKVLNVKNLISDLKKKELPKVKLLKPSRYLIVTSLSLSAPDKDKIVESLMPFIKSANDVIGREDLNYFLSKHPDIERKWYKLWLTSTTVLQTILNNSVIGRSEFYKEKITKRIRLFVETGSLKKAEEILKEQKILLITGQPGVGKTTLANLLVYNFLAQSFQLIYIDKQVQEAEALFDPDPERLQLFYFDDFLGSNYLDLINPKNSESSIVNFVERVQESPNKYLILTTRTTILNHARAMYEQINRSEWEMARKELHLTEYSADDKALILYRHLYHSSLSAGYFQAIQKDKNYWKIIRHKNYTPRLIEFFTRPFNIKDIGPADYYSFVIECLDNPQEVWKHSYINQLTKEDRFLIDSLFSISKNQIHNEIDLNILEKCFNNRLSVEVKKYGHSSDTDSFNKAVKNLLDGYLLLSREPHGSTTVRFINPSVIDFLLSYHRNSGDTTWRIIESASYFDQLEFCHDKLLCKSGKDPFLLEQEKVRLYKFIKRHRKKLSAIPVTNHSKIPLPVLINFQYLLILTRFKDLESYTEEVNSEIAELIRAFNFSVLDKYTFDYLADFLNEVAEADVTRNAVLLKWEEISKTLFSIASLSDEFDTIIDIFNTYEVSIEKYSQLNREMVQKVLNDYIEDDINDIIRDGKSSIENKHDFDTLKNRAKEYHEEFFSKFGIRDSSFDEDTYFYDFELNEIIAKNRGFRERTLEKLKPEVAHKVPKSLDIDDLFS